MLLRRIASLLALAALPIHAQEEPIQPTWETRKGARTFILGIPAPRGQITDRHGEPLAQTRVSWDLALRFPTPLTASDAQALAFARDRIQRASKLLGRDISLKNEEILKHYHDRGVLPLDLATELTRDQVDAVRQSEPRDLTLEATYRRVYPQGALAGHILGYAGKSGRPADGPVQNSELLWPDIEGREGLEQTFNSQLTGQIGQMNLSFDAKGAKASENVVAPPQPGYNVITTLDLRIQRLAEDALRKGAKRGALVVLDPRNGDILALASWPTFDPNLFSPAISQADYARLRDDPELPLLPRAYRSSYPPGSVFKVFVGLAAFQSNTINGGNEFACPPALNIGRLTFRNWKRTHGGDLNFVEALTQSCNTWFYQVGIKTGSKPIIEWARRSGFGEKTGIPLNSETPGRIPDDEYMRRVYKRPLLEGDVANLSIGQGDVLISPLQMAQGMGAIGNGGTLYQSRLVSQVQSIDSQIVNAYGVRAKEFLDIPPKTLAELKEGLVGVVHAGLGTASRARVPGIKVAGKTGTAQWGPKNKERTVAWFAGFAPAEEPRYAFAAMYEGGVGDDVHGGTQAAPLIGEVLRELFKQEKKSASDKGEEQQDSDGD